MGLNCGKDDSRPNQGKKMFKGTLVLNYVVWENC